MVRGEAGIRKTCLLESVASSTADFDVCRRVGIESEMHLGFTALLQLLMPFLGGIESLPSPQSWALRAAFGISDHIAPDPFLVGLAALTLVTTAAQTRRQSLMVVDAPASTTVTRFIRRISSTQDHIQSSPGSTEPAIG